MIINTATFEIEAIEPLRSGIVLEKGSVEITLARETRRVPAHRIGSSLTAKGLVGRYQSGAKAWPAIICQDTERKIQYADFGRDDRCPKFKKLAGVSFA